MSVFDKILNKMNLNDSEVDNPDSYDEDDDTEVKDTTPVKRIKDTSSKSFKNYDDEPEDTPVDRPVRASKQQTKTSKSSSRGNVISMNGARAYEICAIKPTRLDDAAEIIQTLLSGRAVILNLEGLDKVLAQRIFDMALGASYSVDGKFKSISSFIFLVAPKNVELSGDFLGDLSSDDSFTDGSQF